MPCIHCATAILFLDNQFCWAKHFTTVIMVNYSKIPQQIAVYFHGCWYFQTDYILEKRTEPVWDVEYSNSGSNERLVHFLVKHSLLYSSNLVNPIFAKLLVTRCHRSILFSYWTVWSFFFAQILFVVDLKPLFTLTGRQNILTTKLLHILQHENL